MVAELVRSSAAHPAPLPRSDWPLLARVIARLAGPNDKGIGDTITRNLGAPGKWYEAAMKSLAGGCGCAQRRAWLNARYPY